MKRSDSDSSHKQRTQNPRANANFLEIITFSWMLNVFKIGWKRDLEDRDLYTPLTDHTASSLGHKLEEKWRLEMVSAENDNRRPSLLRALIRAFGAEFMFYGFFIFTDQIVLKVSQCLLIGGLLSYFDPENSKTTDVQHAYMCATGIVLCIFVSMVVFHNSQTEVFHAGMKIRVACTSIIYRKALKLSHRALGETTNGHVINLISNDVNRIFFGTWWLHFIWIGPLQTIIVTYFLWREIGVSSLLGIATLIFCFIPLQGWLGKQISNIQTKTTGKTDERVRLINEIISGIQVIKMYTWEKPFSKFVTNARKRELMLVKASVLIKAILISMMLVQTKLQMFVSILAYVLLGNLISAQKVFVVVSLYALLHTSMSVLFRQNMVNVPEIRVSLKRIQKFLLLEENDGQTPKSLEHDAEVKSDVDSNGKSGEEKAGKDLNDFGVDISNATAKWAEDQTANSVENINLTVKRDRLAVIVGPVGSGKSSIIKLILRELPLVEGKMIVRGEVSYASQEPWLFAGSVRQNILFDSPWDEERYNEVIKVCALISDFEQFPCGDQTTVGERGVTLSGGQRARISLARAVYKKADIYLLDDPLSAVDARVGKHLFEMCIKDFLRGKTRIVITHQVQYLTQANQIVLMEHGNITAEGSYQEILASGYDIAKVIGSVEETANDSEVVNQSKSSEESSERISSALTKGKSNGAQAKPDNVAESRSSGRITKNIYLSYFSASGSICTVAMCFATIIITQVLATGVDLWLNFWLYKEEYVFNNVNGTSAHNSENVTCEFSDTLEVNLLCRQTYLTVYAVLVIVLIIVCIIRSKTLASMTTNASLNLHGGMFNAIIRSPVYFFNTNSAGTILNRFSNDIGAIDESLPVNFLEFLQIFMSLLGVIFVVMFVNIYLLIPSIIFGLALYLVKVLYLPTSKSIQRLEAVTRSPVLAYMNESLQGLTTIRAYKADSVVSKAFDSHQDLHSSASYLSITSKRAFGYLLDLISFIYTSIIIFTFLLIDKDTYGGNIGLVITQLMGLFGSLQYGIVLSTILEDQMTSVERVLEYTKCPQETNDDSPKVKTPPKEWPNSGKIVFQNFYMRYSSGSPYALKNLNFQIQPTEKIGIVGRTGAGKSSIISALFRLAVNEGDIIIDGIDTNELGLHELRSKLSIIPQEPFLFSGTMRKNLDPYDEQPDHVLWNALEEVELKVVIESLPGGLNSKMSENGSNLSVGQRQLVCLARAIVRNAKILVLDEATANVDPQTDALIQNTIRNKFRFCTVLTIAHRLNTVMDSDRILVMDDGAAVEFDRPYSLLQNKTGFLCSMVEQTGKATAELLHGVAAESFKCTQERE